MGSSMMGMPNCPGCNGDLDHDVLDFVPAPASQQTQPGQMLIQYGGECPECGERLSGSSFLAIDLE